MENQNERKNKASVNSGLINLTNGGQEIFNNWYAKTLKEKTNNLNKIMEVGSGQTN